MVNRLSDNFLNLKKVFLFSLGFGLMMIADSVFAGAISAGTVADNITASFTGLTKLVTAGCYVAGLAFAVTAILQFKQHKDNPTQITIGKPISLVFIAAALLFMPSVLGVAGFTMFGSGGSDVAGPTGQIFVKPT